MVKLVSSLTRKNIPVFTGSTETSFVNINRKNAILVYAGDGETSFMILIKKNILFTYLDERIHCSAVLG